ncbi:MAG TPA: hypothetical protein VN924_16530 [Bryobacteraceae bacterium]|nr:hypothetical protein [Bryobacteraceae bacterium]
MAFRRVFAARHRAEKSHVSGPVQGGAPQDFVAMFSYTLTGAHLSTIVSQQAARKFK